MAIFLLVVGLILFIGLVVIHELGHFFVARRNGVEAEEFGIFFPPKIWSKKITPKTHYHSGKKKPKTARKPFIFSINALPLGGFVKMKGEHDADTTPGTFGAASTWSKTKIMAAGVGMNLLVAIVLFFILALVGMPQLLPNQYTVKSDTNTILDTRNVFAGKVEPHSPAHKIGLKKGDKLLAIGPPGHLHELNFVTQLHDATGNLAGQKASVKFVESGKTVTKTVRLRSDAVVAKAKKHGKQIGHLGLPATASGNILRRSTWSAPVVALGLTKQFTVLTFQGLGRALSGVGGIIAGAVSGNTQARQAAQTQASSQVSGPVGIFVILKDGSQIGYRFMLMIISIVSLSLAIMNVLPIPALDGGKIFVTYVSRLMRSKVPEKVEDYVYGTSFLLLLGLIGLISYVDVQRFF
jgi:regulator of sigma E protease